MNLDEIDDIQMTKWLCSALNGQEALPRLYLQEPSFIGIQRVCMVLDAAAKMRLKKSCAFLVEKYCQDEIGDNLYVNNLLLLASEFNLSETLPALEKLAMSFDFCSENQMQVLWALADMSPKRPPDFWNIIAERHPEHILLALSGILDTDYRQAMSLLPRIKWSSDLESVCNGIILKMELRFSDLKTVRRRKDFIDSLEGVAPLCRPHVMGHLQAWAETLRASVERNVKGVC